MDETEAHQAAARTDFWMKVAGVSFGLWSVALGYAVKSLNDFQTQFSAYVLATERRVTLLEERQMLVLRKLDRIESQHEQGVK